MRFIAGIVTGLVLGGVIGVYAWDNKSPWTTEQELQAHRQALQEQRILNGQDPVGTPYRRPCRD